MYAHNERLVGYVLYGVDLATGSWKIFRLMIDHTYQGQGYGRAAMERVLADIAEQPDGSIVLVSYHQANVAARRLYEQFDFVEIERTADQVVARRDVTNVYNEFGSRL